MKKHVGYLLEDPRISGPFKQILNISFSLKNSFNQTIVFSNNESKRSKEILDKLSINYLSLETKILSSNISNFLYYLLDFVLSFKKNYYEIKNCKFNLVFINGSSQFKFLIICWLLKIKIIWCINDAYSSKVLRVFIRLFSFIPDHTVFVSNNSKKFYLNNFFKKKSFSIINSSYNFDIQLDGKNSFNKSNYKQLNEKFIVGSVGNISPVKNYEFMVEIAKLAYETDKSIFFLIGGAHLNSQKKYSLKLNKMIKGYKLNNILFADYINDTPSFYHSIDIYASYSKSEASPTSVWEAMYFKKPIVSTNTGDLEILNAQDQFGFIINEFNQNEFLKKIIQIKNDTNLFDKLSKSSYLQSRNFNNNQISKKYLNLFNNFL